VSCAALPGAVVVVAHDVDKVQIAVERSILNIYQSYSQKYLRRKLGDVVACVSDPIASADSSGHQKSGGTEFGLQLLHQTCKVCLQNC
jgi:hypothetical protein